MNPTGQAGGLRANLIYVGFLTLLSFLIYSEIFTYKTFGPETAMFYYENDGHSFELMLRSYTYFQLSWYRPTGFALPYWLISQFFNSMINSVRVFVKNYIVSPRCFCTSIDFI